MGAFVSTIPYNLYALLSILLVVVLCLADLDFGPMAKAQRLAEETGDLGAVDAPAAAEEAGNKPKGRVYDLIISVAALIVFSVLAMLYTGRFFNGEGLTLAEAFGDCDSSMSLVLGGFGGLLVAFLLFIPRKVVGFKAFMEGIGEGIKSMVPACTILTLAWTISGVCGDLLGTGQYVGELVRHFKLSLYFPACHHFCGGGAALLLHRYGVGHLWHPDPHRHGGHGAGRGSEAGDGGAGGDAGRLRFRRPLLPYFGYDHPFVHRCGLQPHPARFHPDALCAADGGCQLLRIPGGRLQPGQRLPDLRCQCCGAVGWGLPVPSAHR